MHLRVCPATWRDTHSACDSQKLLNDGDVFDVFVSMDIRIRSSRTNFHHTQLTYPPLTTSGRGIAQTFIQNRSLTTWISFHGIFRFSSHARTMSIWPRLSWEWCQRRPASAKVCDQFHDCMGVHHEFSRTFSACTYQVVMMCKQIKYTVYIYICRAMHTWKRKAYSYPQCKMLAQKRKRKRKKRYKNTGTSLTKKYPPPGDTQIFDHSYIPSSWENLRMHDTVSNP